MNPAGPTNSPLLSPEEIVRRLRAVKAIPTISQVARDAGITDGYLHKLALGKRSMSLGSPAHHKLSVIFSSPRFGTEKFS